MSSEARIKELKGEERQEVEETETSPVYCGSHVDSTTPKITLHVKI